MAFLAGNRVWREVTRVRNTTVHFPSLGLLLKPTTAPSTSVNGASCNGGVAGDTTAALASYLVQHCVDPLSSIKVGATTLPKSSPSSAIELTKL